MVRPCFLSAVLRTALASVLLATTASAQTLEVANAPCDGATVTSLRINPERPSFSGTAARWQKAARMMGLHHATTREAVIRAYLLVQPGGTCTEFRRAESERVLRALPFLSNASVRTISDGNGQVAVQVTTTDEIPVLVGARFRGASMDAFNLGNENLAGTGLRLEGRVEQARSYQVGFGVSLQQDALFGKPYRLLIDAQRYRVGHDLGLEMEHPIFTDLQRVSWHAGVRSREDYVDFDRPARDRLALRVMDRSWDVSTLARLFGIGTVTLLGGAVSGRRFDPAAQGIVIDDTGFAADTGSALRNRYRTFRSGRIGVTGGIRRVTFRTVRGFDALTGAQDVANGAMIGMHAARGLASMGESDAFLSGAMYAGVASAHTLLATLAQVEGRRDPAFKAWDSVIGSSRTAFYWGSAPGIVLVVSDELSGGVRSRLPLQLTFNDRDGGLLGYRRAALSGEQRNVARAEVRLSGAALVRRADVGFAAFGESGTLRAGDVPYGTNVTRTTLGVSLLAAYPSGAKRMYRVDVGVPLTRGGDRGGAIEVRFSSRDRTQDFWREPDDVSRARTGTQPGRLFAWPSR